MKLMWLVVLVISASLIIGIVGVGAQSSSFASSVTYQPRASFQAVYGPEDRFTTYWPILGDRDSCKSRQDLLLQVAPAGCTPSVVRSDLLAEQNVPVFCQINALQINPLIDIQQIRSISFSSNYPKDIIGAGYHPAQAALNSRDKLLGSPLINNIGYVVVVLKKNEKEKDLPDYVNVNLTGRIAYEADNVFGVGKAEFILEPTSDYDWDSEKFKQSFWNGRYYVRLESAEPNYAVVSLYDGIRKIATSKVAKGSMSEPIWMPGAYCRAGVKIAFDDMVIDQNKAIIDVNDDKGTDRITVYQGSRFLNGKCSVEKLEISGDNKTGQVSVRCDTGEKFVLKLSDSNASSVELYLSETYDAGKKIGIFIDKDKKENSGLYFEGGKVYVSIGEYEAGSVNSDGTINIDKTNFENGVSAMRSSISSKITKDYYDLFSGAKINGDMINNVKLSGKNIDKDLGEAGEKEFKDAIAALERIADEYPAEREKDINISKIYGEEALKRAIELARISGKESEKTRLMRKFINIYPDSSNAGEYKYEISRMRSIDSSASVGVVKIDNAYKTIRIVDFSMPRKISSANFIVTGVKDEKVSVNLEKLVNVVSNGAGTAESIRFDKIIDENNAVITVNCILKEEAGKKSEVKSQSFNLKANDKATKVCDKNYVTLESVNLERIAKIRLVPESQGTETLVNLSVTIGIEKRAIKLSTDKTEEMIENLNESIKKWEGINENLGKVVEGLKGACFATAGVLMVKNFFTGISGEALARNKVMQGENGWNRQCANMVSAGTYDSLTECYNANRGAIAKDVSEAQRIIGEVNTKIAGIEKAPGITQTGTGFLGTGKSVDRSKAAVAYCNQMKIDYKNEPIKLSNGKTTTIEELLGNCDKSYNEEGAFGYEQLREIEYNLKLRNSGASDSLKNINSSLQSSYETIYENRERYNETQTLRALAASGVPAPAYVSSKAGRANIVTQVLPVGGMKESVKPSGMTTQYVATVNADGSKDVNKEGKEIGFEGGVYYVGLTKNTDGGYSVTEVFDKNKNKLDSTQTAEFLGTYNIGGITSADRDSYINPYANPEVRYYDREPYKGMPAVVPFDIQTGWYAATKQTLPILSGVKPADASGRVTSFYLCNVGKNGREQFFEGIGDDICQQINLNTGQPLGFFPGLDDVEARKKVSQGIEALNEAANQYGKKRVIVNKNTLEVGAPAASIPSAQCQNFMSPEECQILFNVCDPVVCPSSRCDLGGKYPVANVIQTGIIGSTLLCLPNVKEGIIIPVCLTGIHAGIEGYVSILNNHRDCLQESLNNGKMIGLCDQIYSVYLCEFFWRQIAPVAKVLLPKLIESAYGEGERGGGEYLSVMAAWENTQNSINYFTQSYAVNSMQAFQLRSVEEAGTPICKAFVSAKFPKSFDALVEPDSPPQFHAWFSTTTYTDATVPATSQYKVFYHIYAGKDSGVQFSVYLKNPPESSYYTIPAVIQVATGFVGKGQYATESKDFTAPEGYKELCVRVNNQEECGFKEVSTSFALNYLSDSYAKSEIDTKNIKSESECISGSPNLGAALTTPNIAAGAEEALLPSVSQRGIVRICATQNPGNQTNPTRFVEVGYCDDQKIKCWMDKESVKNAISDSNVGIKKTTLAELEKTQQATLAEQGLILDESSANAEIYDYKKKVDALKSGLKNGENVASAINLTLDRMNLLFNVIVLNHQKANILYLIGDLMAAIAENKIKPQKAGENVKVEEKEPTKPDEVVEEKTAEFLLSTEYNKDISLNVIEKSENGERIIFTINKGMVYLGDSDLLMGVVRLSSDGNYIIQIKNGSSYDYFAEYMKNNAITSDSEIQFYYGFNNAMITGNKIKLL